MEPGEEMIQIYQGNQKKLIKLRFLNKSEKSEKDDEKQEKQDDIGTFGILDYFIFVCVIIGLLVIVNNYSQHKGTANGGIFVHSHPEYDTYVIVSMVVLCISYFIFDNDTLEGDI